MPRQAKPAGVNGGRRISECVGVRYDQSTTATPEPLITRESKDPEHAWRDVARHMSDHDLRHCRARATSVLAFAAYESPHPEHDKLIVRWQIDAIDAELATRERRASIPTGTRAGYSDTFVQDLKARLPLHDLIENTGDALHKAGREYRGHCPFHDSRSGISLTVNPEKGLWRCWGCGRGGDHYTWLTERWGLDFPDAVAALAALAGAELPQQPTIKRRPKRRAVSDA